MQDKLFEIVNLLRYCVLARYRKGFSVHSPFVFELLNNAFFEKNHYYCYEKIDRIIAQNFPKYLQTNKLKYYKLIFRLANYFDVKKILIAGKNDLVEQIFTFVSSKMQIFRVENLENVKNFDFDLMFFTENSFKNYDGNSFFFAKNNTILIFESIYKKRKINENWKQIIKDNNLKISIDVFSLGIIIAKNNIPKQHYRVAF
jgi:hypothetical protein